MAARFRASALLLLFASCTGPPFFVPASYPSIDGISAGDSADHVRNLLGKPSAWESGWWRDGGIRYEADFEVWFYAGKGRVVLAGDGRVVLSEADPRQPASAIPQPYHGGYSAD